MKRILLGTTTLIGAAGLFAGAALAETPKVTLGGFADFQVGVVSEDTDVGLRSHGFRSDTEITFRIDGKTDAGLGYGGGVDLEADVDGSGGDSRASGDLSSATSTGFDSDAQGFNASRTFVYLEGGWGRVEMGSDLGVTKTMKVDASNIARATGGVDGDFNYFITPASGLFVASPDLILDYGFAGGYAPALGDESTENNNKVTYYTPRFSGFQLGLSYIVDIQAERGQLVSRQDATAGDAENIFAGAISWDGKWDNVGIALAATGEWGNAEASGTEDLRTWNAGAKFTYMGISLAGSYGSWGDSLRATGGGVDDTNYWTAGAAYEWGPFGASVTYLDSEYDTGAASNDFQNISVGVDYKLAPGLTPYAEVSFVEQDLATGTDNDGTVFIAGTQLNF